MKQIELVWRELANQAIEHNETKFSQTILAKKLSCSLSTVNHALFPLRELGIVVVGKRQSYVVDCERLLFYWATRRSLSKDIIYKTYSSLSVFEREGTMPHGVIATAYSACRLYYSLTPVEYDVVYFYCDDIESIENRFPKNSKNEPNIFILKPDRFLTSKSQISQAQVFVDLWNVPQWYAKDYYDALLLEIRQKIGI